MPIHWRSLFAVVLLLCSTSLLGGQVDRANLKGTVLDTTGAVVPDAQVSVTFLQTGYVRTVQSTSAGEYVFSALPLGRCKVSVQAAGFEAKQVNDVELQVGEFRTVDLQLGVGTLQDSVSVDSTVTLDQDSAATAGVIARQQVENLPINGRNWAGLMILVPGAINTGSGNQTSIRFAGHGLDDNKSSSTESMPAAFFGRARSRIYGFNSRRNRSASFV